MSEQAERHEQAVREYEAARAARVERYREYGAHAAERSAAAMERERATAGMIPVGQPVLLGHHSEGRHRRDIARMDRLIRTAVAEDGKAAYWQRRADRLEAGRTVRSGDPDALRKLREQLAGLAARRDRRVAINARLRAGAALADLDLSPEERADLELVRTYQPEYGAGYAAGTRYPPYALRNLAGEMRRVQERIRQLEGTAHGGD